MMKPINILYSLLLLIIFTGTACKKYLEKKSSTSFVSPQTLEDLQGLLDDGAGVMNKRLTPSLGEASTDDQFMLPSTFANLITLDQHFYLWQKTPYYFENDWSKSYAAVYNANFCLDGLTKIERRVANASAWDLVKGTALFYRAYCFLNLLWNYSKAYNNQTSESDLGIVLRDGSDFNVPSVRSSVKECYQQVIDDAKASITLLPNLNTHVYRPSKCAAYGLLARIYLSMREYDSAHRYADLCLSIKRDLLDYNSISSSSNQPFPAFNNEIIFYTEMFPVVSVVGLGLMDTLLYKSYEANDLRKTAFFRAKSGYYAYKGSYATSGFFTGIATDELYLIRAECNARMGNDQSAQNDLNELLKNRYLQPYIPSTVSKDSILPIILQERRKELLRRGLRWMDIKRLNLEGADINLERVLNGITYNLKANDNYFALPLPTDIIEISGIEQNP
ncbi:RagB/SusD family nutrient uptake outer membrane protein [Niabella beijingensis]|uniref:RagB/SusD family nutrient uptake outer membrane protein n=1 Tax=Niabella beijingensis TaxID=2872700 RepID=UPI001CBAF751|nr:RagB/SusD family nutrient uptake outer membrane protein [Niabella beijingensis]MBZ4188955.1 RagB/SusD family nutrient uptake outer membrane protein [Niabella beijingensis]